MTVTKIAAPKIVRLELADAEYLIQAQTMAQRMRDETELMQQIAMAHELGKAQTLRLLAGPGDWKLARDENGYYLTKSDEMKGIPDATPAPNVQNPA